VARHLKDRYGDQFDRVDDSAYTFVYQPRFHVPSNTLVSIVIPTRDKATLLDACIQSIHHHTTGIAYEILVLDNNSTEPETQVCFQRLVQDKRVRVIEASIPFNWSRLNNIGRGHATGQVLVFLNNDTEVITPDWLLRLSEYALLPDVATVGPLLLYPDHTIQHAGVVVGMGGWADHVFKNDPVQHYPTPFISSAVPRNVLASTGACVAIATERLDALGGFDEAFEICGSDVELGIRGHKQGLLNVYLPAVQLFHLESKTRTPFVPEVDFQQSALKYAPYRLDGDPFFNPNLDLASTSPQPRYPGGSSFAPP
jgi:GT2 family glycosyltransferase